MDSKEVSVNDRKLKRKVVGDKSMKREVNRNTRSTKIMVNRRNSRKNKTKNKFS